ncbi:nucleotidyltransferase family protein [Novosphingobium sp. TH158]|uniref:nucleotidyltransferase domain-containing protein n=1 Tax=Novosphingobium sp. TH158 TaxID=2067455 RepID=UPI000C7D0877|nr:nucleotidyltransferase family protein [Novosphingobium sp. TH158]PLK26701.1 hypothetical protein C0V78_07230 [Novosphingobium sp. TH158]
MPLGCSTGCWVMAETNGCAHPERAGEVVLALMSPVAPLMQADIDVLEEADWGEIARLVNAHRLQPLLHWSLESYRPALVLPEAVVRDWMMVRRQQAMRALAIKSLLGRIASLFDTAELPWRALKGAYLAFHTYDAPELRPMRDLDLLVPESRVGEAFAMLLANGGSRLANIAGEPEAFLATNRKHMPPILFAKADICVELHTHLLAPAQATPGLASEAVLACAPLREASDPIPYIDRERLVLHLIIHAVYEHKFDNGPLAFTDIASVVGSQPFDWARFWRMCREGEHERGAVLALRIAEYICGQPLIDRTLDDAPDRVALPDVPDSWIVRLLPALTRTQEDRVEYALSNQISGGNGSASAARMLNGRLFRSRQELISEFGEDGSRYVVLCARLWSRLLLSRLPSIWRFIRRSNHAPRTVRMREIDAWLAGGASEPS